MEAGPVPGLLRRTTVATAPGGAAGAGGAGVTSAPRPRSAVDNRPRCVPASSWNTPSGDPAQPERIQLRALFQEMATLPCGAHCQAQQPRSSAALSSPHRFPLLRAHPANCASYATLPCGLGPVKGRGVSAGGVPRSEKQASPRRGPRAAVHGTAGVKGTPRPIPPAAGVASTAGAARLRTLRTPACLPDTDVCSVRVPNNRIRASPCALHGCTRRAQPPACHRGSVVLLASLQNLHVVACAITVLLVELLMNGPVYLGERCKSTQPTLSPSRPVACGSGLAGADIGRPLVGSPRAPCQSGAAAQGPLRRACASCASPSGARPRRAAPCPALWPALLWPQPAQTEVPPKHGALLSDAVALALYLLVYKLVHWADDRLSCTPYACSYQCWVAGLVLHMRGILCWASLQGLDVGRPCTYALKRLLWARSAPWTLLCERQCPPSAPR